MIKILLREYYLDGFPDFIVSHIFSPDGVADVELGANGTDEAPVEFGVAGAILFQ